MAAKGYPGRLRQGHARSAASTRRARCEGVEIFHAGTRRDGERLLATGGRVLNVTARGKTVAEAQAARLRGGARDRLARRLLPHRHRLAGHRAGERQLMNVIADLFPGFAEQRIKTAAPRSSCAPAAPARRCCCCTATRRRTSCWHKVAPELARHCTLVIPDLRGYGASSAPPGDAEHKVYSKRAMAAGLPGGHARARTRALHASPATTAAAASPIGWRSTIPRRVRALVPVDIMPTGEVWRRITAERRHKAYHWAFLAQPHPLPETLIGKDPVYYLEHTLKSWAGPRDLSPFSAEALAHYRALLQEPGARARRVRGLPRRRHASTAGSTRPTSQPAARSPARHSCCGATTISAGGGSPLEVWRGWCTERRPARR